MTENKRIVERYMEGFNKSDHEQILSLCYTKLGPLLPSEIEDFEYCPKVGDFIQKSIR